LPRLLLNDEIGFSKNDMRFLEIKTNYGLPLDDEEKKEGPDLPN
jgi:hypothetical protein